MTSAVCGDAISCISLYLPGASLLSFSNHAALSDKSILSSKSPNMSFNIVCSSLSSKPVSSLTKNKAEAYVANLVPNEPGTLFNNLLILNTNL